jgi:hypothetical protein
MGYTLVSMLITLVGWDMFCELYNPCVALLQAFCFVGLFVVAHGVPSQCPSPVRAHSIDCTNKTNWCQTDGDCAPSTDATQAAKCCWTAVCARMVCVSPATASGDARVSNGDMQAGMFVGGARSSCAFCILCARICLQHK